MMDGPRGQNRARRWILFALALTGAAGAAALAASNGFSLRLHGIRISSHGGLRPALFALLFAVAAYRLHPRSEDLVALWQRSVRVLTLLVPWIAPACAAIVLALGIAYGVRAAGGSDVYGYVSEARLWVAGDLRVHQDFVASVPWPNKDWTFSPLGYRPSSGHSLVPSYAPGLPLLMAVFLRVGGDCGPFMVNPICGAVLVLLASALGVRLSGRVTGAIAAILVASSPTLLFMTFWPMSDVPAAVFWIGSLVVACRPGSLTTALLSGLLSSVAIAIRPNLVPLAAFPAVVGALLQYRHSASSALRSVAMFAIGCTPGVVFIAWFNHHLYGSVLESGYGGIGSIYKWQYLADNLRRYPRWLWETQGATIILFAFALVIPAGPRLESTLLRRVLLTYVVAVFACYLFYAPFDDWWYLRFVAPALPVMFVLAADAVWIGSARFGEAIRVTATVVFVLVAVNQGVWYARTHAIFEIGDGEQKYADVGRYVGSELRRGAVVLTSQHTGSIRYYSGAVTMQFGSLDREWLDRAIDHLKASGPAPYIVLEGWEIAGFRERFASQRSVSLLDRAPLAVHSRDVYVYDTEPRAAEPPHVIPPTGSCR